jgi:integrase
MPMQQGSVLRHGRGWRGYWRENGKRCATATYSRKGLARAALDAELARIAQGDAYRPPIKLRELSDRFLEQYVAAPQTVEYARRRLRRPLTALGEAQARDVTPEALQRIVAPLGPAYRRDIVRTLRMVYRFGIENGLVDRNPAARVKAPMQRRSPKMLPFESLDEVDAVAQECGRWGPLVVFMADTGARPGEAVALEHRHVSGAVVELPGTKTDGAWRAVHMTKRGQEAIGQMPRALATSRVFHIDGRPISWRYFHQDIWGPALQSAGLAPRPPYALRHTFAYLSLRAGVPIAVLAREMGHATTEQTFRVYGGWCREMGADAAKLRSAWAEKASGGTNVAPGTSESP